MIVGQVEAYRTYADADVLQENAYPEMFEALWTVEDVAGFLKLQPETIRCMARRGELPAIKIGKVWRFQKAAICEMLARLA